MIQGKSYSAAYVYDISTPSSPVLYDTITFKQLLVTNPQWPRVERVSKSPLTGKVLTTVRGFDFQDTIQVFGNTYDGTYLQYQADQGVDAYQSEAYKAIQLERYWRDGYEIRWVPRVDLLDLYPSGGYSYIKVDVKIVNITGHLDDSVTLELTSSDGWQDEWMPFVRFKFYQCLSLDGVNDEATFTETNCGTTQAIEIWIDANTPGASSKIISAFDGANSHSVSVDGTNITFTAAGVSQAVAHGGFSSGTKTHFFINRTGTSVDFFKNGARLSGSPKTLASNPDFHVECIGRQAAGTDWFTGKIGPVRIYEAIKTDAVVLRQYSRGYGNYPAAAAITELFVGFNFDGTGTTETDISDNAIVATLVGATRSTF